MSEIEYPRWVHAPGRKSVIAETPEDEEAFLAAVQPFTPEFTPLPAAPQRYDLYPLADASGVHEESSSSGAWVRWNDVASLFGGNLLTDAALVPAMSAAAATTALEAVSDAPKRTGGWPKGKPRQPKQASVN